MNKSWVIINLSNILIVSFLGLLLRFSQLFLFNIPYGYYLHAHSHMAILGWLCVSFFILIYQLFIPKNNKNKQIYQRLFIFTQISIWGMLFSFPIQGYGFISIAFSTMHIFCSYAFCWVTWRNLKSSGYDQLFLKTSLLLMLGSTLGIWGLGGVMAIVGKESFLHPFTIQFFLHFQINGWFLFALFACLLKLIKKQLNHYPQKTVLFYVLNVIAVFFSFSLPLLRYKEIEIPYLNIFQNIGNILFLFSLFLYIKYIQPVMRGIIKNKPFYISITYYSFLSSLILKILIPLFLLIPNLSDDLLTINNFYIGFIHLVVLGIYTSFLLLCLGLNVTIKNKPYYSIGISVFISAFLMTEILLLLQGFFVYLNLGNFPFYHPLIVGFSILFPIGIFFIIWSLVSSRYKPN